MRNDWRELKLMEQSVSEAKGLDVWAVKCWNPYSSVSVFIIINVFSAITKKNPPASHL